MYKSIKEVSYDETTHVSFLTDALKGMFSPFLLPTSHSQFAGVNATPVAECTYAFGVTDVNSFLATAAILEGVGVSAYLGAAASIMEKLYLTAAASILTVEARHSSFIRKAIKESPFPQPFDAPLTLNEVYTLAAPFIVSCPDTNGALPVKAFPMLSLDPACAPAAAKKTITLFAADPVADLGSEQKYFAAWVAVTGPVSVPATLKDGKAFTTKVPMGFHGQSYVVITKEEGCVTDDCVVAGPAIVEVKGASGDVKA